MEDWCHCVDLMPTDESVLGFTNRWYGEAATSAMRLRLPGGAMINLISAPAFLATKFEAFQTRGNADFVVSHDFEDIINVVEGRSSIVEEVAECEMTMRAYLCAQFDAVLSVTTFMNILPGLLVNDALHTQRVESVMKRMKAITAMKA